MRVHSARAKQPRRIKLVFQRLLNSLLDRIELRQHGHIDLQRSAGLLRAPEQSHLTTYIGCHLP